MIAEEFIKKHYEIDVKNHFLNFDKNGIESYEEYAKRNPLKTLAEGFVEFAQYHTKLALKEASNKATIKIETFEFGFVGSEPKYYVIDKNSILNSYDLNNIK